MEIGFQAHKMISFSDDLVLIYTLRWKNAPFSTQHDPQHKRYPKTIRSRSFFFLAGALSNRPHVSNASAIGEILLTVFRQIETRIKNIFITWTKITILELLAVANCVSRNHTMNIPLYPKHYSSHLYNNNRTFQVYINIHHIPTDIRQPL